METLDKFVTRKEVAKDFEKFAEALSNYADGVERIAKISKEIESILI